MNPSIHEVKAVTLGYTEDTEGCFAVFFPDSINQYLDFFVPLFLTAIAADYSQFFLFNRISREEKSLGQALLEFRLHSMVLQGGEIGRNSSVLIPRFWAISAMMTRSPCSF